MHLDQLPSSCDDRFESLVGEVVRTWASPSARGSISTSELFR
jgi:hypothetical protein